MLMKTDMKTNPPQEQSDASLVLASRAGDRRAFAEIVSRYQRLLCSLAYSSLGNLSESEDVAQETFVEAWKKLENLNEPEKLKSWLCGILRFKISHHRRKEARQPIRHANELGEMHELESNSEPIETSVMREEEQALLWQALEAVPETYRETLILYYREHRSVEHVADELDLSTDAVKQRLSRGRKLLQQRMMSFVEGALERTAPGPAFTAGVVALLVTAAPTAKAAGAGMTAAKVGSTFKWASIVAFLASISGLISSFFALRANLDQSRTGRERKAVIRTTLIFLGTALVYVAGMFALRSMALESPGYSGYLAVCSQLLLLVFLIGYLVLTQRLLKNARALRTAEKIRRPELFEPGAGQSGKREIKSRARLFGVPLLHVKLDMPERGEAPAIAWVAAGHRAYGLLFAWGGYAVAPISVGIVSVGVVTAGAVGVGIVGVGAVGIGLLAIGASAIGYKAYGSLSATGWESAFSPGFSIAKEAAIGPIAYAEHVNNELAYTITRLAVADQFAMVILGAVALLVIVPVVWYARVVRKNLRKSTSD